MGRQQSHIQPRNSPYFMEPESSLPCSQKPATCICPSQLYPVHSLPSYSPQKHFNIILLPTPTNFTSVSTPKSLHTALPLPHTCQMPSPSHPPYNKRSIPCTKTHHHTFCCILLTQMSTYMSPNLRPDPWHRKSVAVQCLPIECSCCWQHRLWHEPRNSGGDNSVFPQVTYCAAKYKYWLRSLQMTLVIVCVETSRPIPPFFFTTNQCIPRQMYSAEALSCFFLR